MTDLDIDVRLGEAGRQLARNLDIRDGVAVAPEQTAEKPEWLTDDKGHPIIDEEAKKKKEEARKNWESVQAEKAMWEHSRVEIAREAMRVEPDGKLNYGDQLSRQAIAYVDAVREKVSKIPYKDETERREVIKNMLQIVDATQKRMQGITLTSEEQGYAMQAAIVEAVGANGGGEVEGDIVDLLGQNILANKKEVLALGKKSSGILGFLSGERKGSTEVNISRIEDVVAAVIKGGDKQPFEVRSAVAAVRETVQAKYPVK